MPGVTKEQIARARQVDVLDYVLKNEADNIRRVGMGYRLKDHPSLAVGSSGWYWHSQEFGGKTALDYLTNVRGYGLVEAVCSLIGERPSERSGRSNIEPPQSITPNETPLPTQIPFSLPVRYKDNNRVIAYLQNRGIDKALILDCIERGVLYESKDYHNCVFMGKDENGKTRFAALRSTISSFKRDADGSDKRYGFMLPPSDPNSREIAIFEAPIDALSHQTLCKQGLVPAFDGWRLSLGGTSAMALTNFLEHHSEVTHCLICTDNDDAGNRIAAKIESFTGLTTARSPPTHGKDWNETLKTIRNEVNTLEDVRQDIRFIDSHYKTLFTIKDGDKIKFASGYDGKVSEPKCRFIDEMHMTLDGETYHMCQWAEICERNGHKYEPAAKQERKIDILSAKYGEALQAAAIPMTDAALKRLVGGKYDVTPLRYPSGKVCAALVSGKEGIAVCGIKNEILTSLHPYNAQTYKRELSPAERPAQPAKKPSLQNKLDNAKGKAAEHNAANANGVHPKKRDAAELG